MKLCVCVLLQVLGEAFLALEGLDTVGKSANKPGGLFPARTRGRHASLEAALRGPLDPKAIRLTIEATVLVGMSATGLVFGEHGLGGSLEVADLASVNLTHSVTFVHVKLQVFFAL